MTLPYQIDITSRNVLIPQSYWSLVQSLLCDPNPNPSPNAGFPFFSFQSMLCDPNANSPANSEAALLFSENKREYNRRVREIVEQSWTED
ncbi:hypothetical protein CsSME_00049612 [Camellia sinensis var. sinensis]